MTDKKILYAVIEKVVKNGLEIGFSLKDIKEILENNTHITPVLYYWIIFLPEFAKAFWGEQEHEYYDNGSSVSPCKFCSAYREEYEETVGKYCWQQHLSDMVLEEKRLKYLEKFVNE